MMHEIRLVLAIYGGGTCPLGTLSKDPFIRPISFGYFSSLSGTRSDIDFEYLRLFHERPNLVGTK